MNRKHTNIKLSVPRLVRLLIRRRALRQHDQWTRPKLLEHQTQSLKMLRDHAYAHSPFYRRFHAGLMDVPLGKLPVLTKNELMEHWNDVVTDRTLNIDDLRMFVDGQRPDNPLLFRGEYVVSTTSGSTGLKGAFAFNRDEWLWGLASHGRAMEWAKQTIIHLLHKTRLATVSSQKPWCKSLLVGASVDTPLLSSLRLDSTEPLQTITEILNRFQPEVLVAYAETAKALAQRQIGGELTIAPGAVFTSSEILTLPGKKTIVRAWGREPFNAYAATETALIAADCEHHQMHIGEDLLIVEVVDKNDQPVPAGTYGEKILITVLFSRTLPLIRYEMSDSVMIAKSDVTCACGKPFAILAGIEGRVEDTMRLQNTDGEAISVKPDIFHDVLEPAPVAGWQVTQESRTGILVSIVGPQKAYDEKTLIDTVRDRLRDQGVDVPVVRVEILEKLRQSASGKTPLVKALKTA